MGCDIHIYLERKIKNKETKQWISVDGKKNPGRNYYIFGLMAGVRQQPYDSLNKNREFYTLQRMGMDDILSILNNGQMPKVDGSDHLPVIEDGH